MQQLNTDIAFQLLVAEYPVLKEIQIVKQFQTKNGRKYNTFLAKDKDLVFVAKGTVLSQYNIEYEYHILKLLMNEFGNCPKLINANHQPISFLLLEFIDGLTVNEALEQNNSITSSIFFKIGQTLAGLHSIPAESFGKLDGNDIQNWETHIETKILKNLENVRPLLSNETYTKSLELFNSLKSTIEDENNMPPKLIHRDIYLENFMIENKTERLILLDYAMAVGGRPIYDHAKFFILELYNRPQFIKDFLAGYYQSQPKPENYSDLLKLYLLTEAIGMINYFNNPENEKNLKHALQILKELTENSGRIIDIIYEI